MAYGGFGCSPADGLHSRMNSMIGVAVSDPESKVHNIELCGDDPGTIVTNDLRITKAPLPLKQWWHISPKT